MSTQRTRNRSLEHYILKHLLELRKHVFYMETRKKLFGSFQRLNAQSFLQLRWISSKNRYFSWGPWSSSLQKLFWTFFPFFLREHAQMKSNDFAIFQILCPHPLAPILAQVAKFWNPVFLRRKRKFSENLLHSYKKYSFRTLE